MLNPTDVIEVWCALTMGFADAGSVAPWWTGREAGLWGGIGGSLIGCMGAVIGTLNSMGRGRVIVLGLLKFMLVFGIFSGATGIVALVNSQPYAVYYPLLLVGLLCTVLPLALYGQVQRRFELLELQQAPGAGAGPSSTEKPI